jgi:hypothetical protein
MYNEINNPIPRNGLWATPSLEQISDQIESFPPEQKAQMYNVLMLTLNACNQLVEVEILSREISV